MSDPREVHAAEQALANTKLAAACAAEFLNELKACGVEHGVALYLTEKMIAAMYYRSPGSS